MQYKELLKPKPINEFGGWLRFFQVFNIIILVISGYRFVHLVMQFVEILSEVETLPNILYIFTITTISLAFIIYFTYRMIYYVTQQVNEIPNIIISYQFKIAILSIAFYVIIFMLAGNLSSDVKSQFPGLASLSNWKELTANIFTSAVTYIIWVTYFKLSKRVKEFYGNIASNFL